MNKYALLLKCLWLCPFFLGAWQTDLWAHTAKPGYLVPNGGQWPKHVLAHVDVGNLRVFIEKDGITWLSSNEEQLEALHLSGARDGLIQQHAWRTNWVGSQFTGSLQWSEHLSTRLNYYIGNDPSKWASGLQPAYELLLKDVYPGIDLHFQTRDGFKYDFIVHPGANPKQIKAEISGLQPTLSSIGELIYPTANGDFKEAAPQAWTKDKNQRAAVPLAFKVHNQTWQFEVGEYDLSTTLVLDPTLVGSTYSGATTDNWGFTATPGEQNDMFLGGIIFSPGYPTTFGAFQSSWAGQVDMTISRYPQNATTQFYATYLGGSNRDIVMSLVTNASNELYLLGKSNSPDFPMNGASYDATFNGMTDMVIARLSANGGQLIASTYLGDSSEEAQNGSAISRYNLNALEFNYGDDSRGEILIDAQGNVLVACNSTSASFPVVGGFQTVFGGMQDGILAKLSPALSSLLYSTFVGGSGLDAVYSVRSLGGDTIVIAGSTFSANFPVANLPLGFSRNHTGSCDGFLLKFRTSPGAPMSGTFLGTTAYDQAYLIDTDNEGKIYVAGVSMGNMPILPASVYFDPGSKHFVQRYNRQLTQLELSTVFGPMSAQSPSLSPTAFMIDICNKIYFSGWGGSTNIRENPIISPMSGMPVSADAIQGSTNGSDMYLLVLDANASAVVYGTYFGGNTSSEHVDGGTCRFSKDGVIYHAVCAGCGGNSDFPTTTAAYSSTNNSGNSGGRCNGAIFNIDLEYVNPVAAFRTQYLDTTVCLNTPVLFNPTGTLFGNFFWNFGVPGATSTSRNPSYTYTAPGTYQVTLIVSTCAASDTITRQVVVSPPPAITFLPSAPACLGDSITLQVTGGVRVAWKPDATLNDTTSSSVRVFAQSSRWYVVTVFDAIGCSATDSIYLEVFPTFRALDQINNQWCYGDSLRITPTVGQRFSAFNWLADADIADPGLANQVFSSLPARWVYLQLTDTSGCTYLDSIWLQPRITVTANGGPDRFVCGPDSIVLTARGGITYLWSTGDTTASIQVYTNTSRVYWVETRIGNCKSLPDSIVVSYRPIEADFAFTPDTAYAPQEVAFQNLSFPNENLRFTWDFGDGASSSMPNPIHVYRQPGFYRIVLKVVNPITGCSDSLVYEYLFVDSIQIMLPNAFTPNGDGTNDVYTGVLRNLRDVDFRIYDRWGGLVFRSIQPEIAWNGNSNGSICQPGVYPYVLEAKGKNGRPYQLTGQIILIR